MVSLAGKASKASKEVLHEMEHIQKNLREAQEADDREAVARLRQRIHKSPQSTKELVCKK